MAVESIGTGISALAAQYRFFFKQDTFQEVGVLGFCEGFADM
jgi:hypothetical protein